MCERPRAHASAWVRAPCVRITREAAEVGDVGHATACAACSVIHLRNRLAMWGKNEKARLMRRASG